MFNVVSTSDNVRGDAADVPEEGSEEDQLAEHGWVRGHVQIVHHFAHDDGGCATGSSQAAKVARNDVSLVFWLDS